MTRSAIALILSFGLVHTLSGAPAVQSADDVIEKHLAAIGGRAALAKLTSRRSIGKVTIGTPNGDITGSIEISAKAPNKARAYMKLDLSAMGLTDPMVLEQKFDGTAAWMLNSLQGDNPITGNQLENMQNNMFPTPLLTYKAQGSTVEVLPREKVGTKALIVLKMTPKLGSAVKMYFDPDTYQLVRTAVRFSTPELGELEQTGEPSDYRDVGGIKVPFLLVNASSVQTVTIRLEKVEHNVPIDDAIFVKK
jgi:zinc protease